MVALDLRKLGETSMKHEIASTKLETNYKFQITNSQTVAISNFGFEISDFKRMKGVQYHG